VTHPYLKIARVSRLFGKTRQAFHQMESRRVQENVGDEILLVYVKEIRRKQSRLGTRKLHGMLREVMAANAIKMGRDKFFGLLRKGDLLVKRRRRYVRTTNSDHSLRKYPNLIEEYVPTGPEQILASDITYLSADGAYVYLSLVTDQYSRKIMGYHVHPTLEAKGPLEALRMALRERTHPESHIIHHSDQGIQYCCEEYTEVLKRNDVQISMSSRGNPYENAIAERVNGILKTEFYLDRSFKDIAQVRSVVKEVVAVYNQQRPHASCDNLTPEQAHVCQGILRKRWKNYRHVETPRDLQPISEKIKKVLEQLMLKSSIALAPA
jgi:putative transposase